MKIIFVLLSTLISFSCSQLNGGYRWYGGYGDEGYSGKHYIGSKNGWRNIEKNYRYGNNGNNNIGFNNGNGNFEQLKRIVTNISKIIEGLSEQRHLEGKFVLRKPKQDTIADLGYKNCGDGWFDVQKQGVKNDYCRWVGNCGCRGSCSYWSCALAGSNEQKTPKGQYFEQGNLQHQLDSMCSNVKTKECANMKFARYGLTSHNVSPRWRCYKSIKMTKMANSCINNWGIRVLCEEPDQTNGYCNKGKLIEEKIKNYIGCYASDDCEMGEECIENNTCQQRKSGSCRMQSKDYQEGEITKMDCFVQKCQFMENMTWIPLATDPTCCSLNNRLVSSNWSGVDQDTSLPLGCRNGEIRVDGVVLEDKVDEQDNNYTREDIDSIVDWYTNFCPNRDKEYTSADLKRDMLRKDASCYGPPPRASQTNKPSLVFYFNGESCVSARVHVHEASKTTTNIFETHDHCQLACISPCNRRPDLSQLLSISERNQNKRSDSYPDSPNNVYYFDSTQGCKRLNNMTYNQIGNLFMDKEDCEFLCSKKIEDINHHHEHQINVASPIISSEIKQNCERIERKIPKLKRISQLFKIANHIISHPRWATVTSNDCQTITVTIRYSCTMKSNDELSIANFRHICINLISQGLIAHYTTTYNYGGTTYNLEILPILTLPNYYSRQFRIKHETSTGLGASGYNLFYIPIKLKVDNNGFNDAWVSLVAAHELGHEILFASRTNHLLGYHWTATHKGTTNLISDTLPTAPYWPPAPTPIDLMYYYNNEGFDPDRTFLAEEDAQVLVEKALFNFLGNCGNDKCQVCLFGLFPCKAGLFCNFFQRCSECRNDGDCSGNQYCAFKLPGCNECRNRKQNGAWCLRNAECINFCHFGRCTECQADNDCPANEYCKNLHKPWVTNVCEPRLANGAWCDRDRMCVKFCHLLRCTECQADNDCPANEYCRNLHKPLITNECALRLNDGAWCYRDRMCINFCDGARCAECEQHWHCPAGQFCRWRNIFGIQNRCKAVCGKICLFDSNCGYNGSGCNDCRGFFGRSCRT